MSISDPFGRHKQRQESAYQSFRESLHKANIDTPEKAQALIDSTWQRALVGLLIALASIGATKLLFPSFTGFVSIFAFLLVIWLITTVYNGRRFLRRYIEEEFKE